MSKPAFPVLEKFPLEIREIIANRTFATRSSDGPYACKNGDCVMAALLRESGLNPFVSPFPSYDEVAYDLDLGSDEEAWPDRMGICAIIAMNDAGKLRTRKAVRKLLLGEE